MECLKSARVVPAIIDGVEPEEDSQALHQHLEECDVCAQAVLEHRRIRDVFRSLPGKIPTAHLETSLRVLASRERTRRLTRINFAKAFATWRNQTALHFKNLMQPFALPVAGGLIASLLLFGILVPDFTVEARPGDSDVPTGLFTDASVKDVAWPIIGEANIVVDVDVDESGRLTDYSIVSGSQLLHDESMRRRFESALLLTQFTPATTFGQPTTGRIRVSFRTSRIDIKG